MTARLLLLAAMFLLTSTTLRQLAEEDFVPAHEPLREFPMRIADWTGQEAPDLDPRAVQILGADEYITRVYRRGHQAPVDFYIGYYQSQRVGDVIHSPLNCLPGSGWQVVGSDRVNVNVSTSVPTTREPELRDIEINRLTVQKHDTRAAVLYWYQGRGRVTSNEYQGKLLLALDAIRRHRTDGALVRVMSPMSTDRRDDAADQVRAFVQAVFPTVGRYIPN